MSFHGLSQSQWDQITTIFKKYPQIETALLFGSRALGNYKPASDIDLALQGKINFDLVAKICAELEEETNLPYKFDVVDYRAIETAAFKKHIDDFGVLIYVKSGS